MSDIAEKLDRIEREAQGLIAERDSLRSRLAQAERVVQAARELDLLEDFSEPIGPGQDPEDWDAYNAKRKALSDALAAFPLDPTTEAS